MEQVCACAEYWGRRYNLSQRQGQQGDEMAGGTWKVEIHGLTTVDEGEGQRQEWGRHCWSFSGAGTFLLRVTRGDDPHPIVELAGDDATPMGVIRETLETVLRRAR